MQKEIRHQWFFPHPPEAIWAYLTDSELLTQWLMPNDFKPIPGHRFMFRTPPYAKLDFDGQIFCEVLEIQEPSKLSYSWKYGSGDGQMRVDSVVEWTLRAEEGGTKLNLLHSGFNLTTNIMDFEALNGGWLSNVKKIENLLLPKTV